MPAAHHAIAPRLAVQFFRMLKVGVPKGGVKQKMRSEGLDPSVLDMDPAQPAPAPGTVNGKAAAKPVKDHPTYAKV